MMGRQFRVVGVFICIMFAAVCVPGCNFKRPVDYELGDHYTVADPQFTQTVGNLLGPPLIGGNTCTTLLNGDQIFPSMLEAIASAQHTITFETYVYWKGDVGHRF